MKKIMTKALSLLMVLAMCMGLGVTALAAEGDFTIEINPAYSGETYSAYKVFDATYNSSGGISYTITEDSPWYAQVSADDSVYILTAVAGQSSTYVVTEKSGVSKNDIVNTLTPIPSKAEVAASETVNKIADTETGETGYTEITLDVSDTGAGFYYVTTSMGTVVSLTTANPTAEVMDKNTVPYLTKEEVNETHHGGTLEGAGDTTEGGEASAKVGDIIEFEIVIGNAANKTTLTLHDYTSAGLTFRGADTIKVHQDTIYTTVDENYYTITTDTNEDDGGDGCDYEITFSDEYLDKLGTNSLIIVTYEAYVNEDAVSINTNDAFLTYGAGGRSAVVETKTDTYGFGINVIDGDEKYTISGATYNLLDANNKVVSFVYDATTGTYTVYDSLEEHNDDVVITTEINAGNVNLFGLDISTYTLVEVGYPEGYAPRTSGLTIQIANTGSIIVEGGNATVVGDTVDISYYQGSLLTPTGGVGTTLMVALGALVVAGATVTIVSVRKRKQA